MKKFITLVLVLTGMVCSANADSMYIIGDGDVLGNWKTNNGLLMNTASETLFYADIVCNSTTNFSFTSQLMSTDSEWDGIKQYRLGPSSDKWGLNYVLGKTETVDVSSNNGNSFQLTEGSYRIVLNTSTNKVRVFESSTKVYILGNVVDQDWHSYAGIEMESEGNHIYTATINTNDIIDLNSSSATTINFTTLLAESEGNDDWSKIWAYRFGSTADGDNFWVTSDFYTGEELSITFPSSGDPKGFRFSSGTYKLTLDYTKMTLKINKFEKVTTNSYGFCTYVNSEPLTITDATAYYAKDNENGSATAYSISNPVAGTPMLIKGDNSKTYYFAVAASGTSLEYTNAFKAGTGDAVATSDANGYNYILNGNAFYQANGKTVAANKAYLQLSQQASARALIFEEEDVTAIHAVESVASATGNEYYDLSGRKVAQPTKGLYIVNGKKVIIK